MLSLTEVAQIDSATWGATLHPTPHFKFKQSLEMARDSGAFDLLDTVNDALDTLVRPVVLGDHPFLVTLASSRAHPLRLDLSVRAADESAPPTEADLALAAEWANRRFWLDFDMEAGRGALAINPYGEDLVARFWPSRPANLSSAWECLIKTVIHTQIYPGLAAKLETGLFALYGTQVSFEGTAYRLYPTPDQLIGASAEDLIAMKFSRQKAKYLPGIARMILTNSDKFDFERLRQLPGDEAVVILDELPGVGTWTAHNVAMRGLAHRDVFIDEDGLRKTLATHFGRKETLSDDDFSRVTALYAPYRSLACYYTYMERFNVDALPQQGK